MRRLVEPLRIAIRCIGYGDRVRDKLAIAFIAALAVLFPIGILARRLGRPLPDPARLVASYRCRNAVGVFSCPGPGGPFFLACDPSYDPGVTAVIDQLSGGTFIDIGANVGFLTVRAAKRLGNQGRVIALEPHPLRYEFLRNNVQLNGLQNVISLRCAAGAETGRAVIHEPDSSFGPHPLDVSLSPIGGRPIDIEIRTFDSLADELDLGELALIKIDVEGFEPEVVHGMSKTLRAQRVPVIFEALSPGALAQTSGLLTKIGYRIKQIDQSNYLAEVPHASNPDGQ